MKEPLKLIPSFDSIDSYCLKYRKVLNILVDLVVLKTAF